jgi:hypothetical protein
MEHSHVLDLTEDDVEQLDAQACKSKLRELYEDRQRRDDYTERLQEKQKALISEVAARRQEKESMEEKFKEEQEKNRLRKKDLEISKTDGKSPENLVRDTMEMALMNMDLPLAKTEGEVSVEVDEAHLIVQKAPAAKLEEKASKDAVLITFHPNADVEYYLTFRCDRHTKVQKLLEDACRHWGVSDIDFVLKCGPSKVISTLYVTEVFKAAEPMGLHLVRKPIRNKLPTRKEELAVMAKVGMGMADGADQEGDMKGDDGDADGGELSFMDQLKDHFGLFVMLTMGEREDEHTKKHLPKLRWSMLLFYFFVLVMALVAFSLRVGVTGSQFWMNESIRGGLQSPPGTACGFMDVKNNGTLWCWLENAVPSVLLDYNSQFRKFNEPIGNLRIQQQRADSGDFWYPFEIFEYNISNVSNGTGASANLRGEEGVSQISREQTPFVSRPTPSNAVEGTFRLYSNFRYSIEYPLLADTAFQEGTTAEEFRKDMAILKENFWIDHMTEAVLVEFVVFNGNYEVWASSRFLFEFLPGTKIRPYTNINTFHPSLAFDGAQTAISNTSSTSLNATMPERSYAMDLNLSVSIDWLRLGLIVLTFGVVVYSERKHLRIMELPMKRYFQSFRFFLDLTIVACTISLVLQRNMPCEARCESPYLTSSLPSFTSSWNIGSLVTALRTEDGSSAVKENGYTYAVDRSQQYRTMDVLDALIVSCLSYRCVSFLRINRRLYIAWKAMTNALTILATFSWIFVPYLIGFIFIAKVFYGASSSDFSTYTRTAGTLIAMLNGEFNVASVLRTNRVWTVVFSLVFTLTFMFFLLNVFTAIIIRAFNEARIQYGYRLDTGKYSWSWADYRAYFFWGWVRRAASRVRCPRRRRKDDSGAPEDDGAGVNGGAE